MLRLPPRSIDPSRLAPPTMPPVRPPPQLAEMDLEPILGVASVMRKPVSALPALIADTHALADLPNLCLQMCHVLLAMGRNAFALEMQARALAQRQVYRIGAASDRALRLLAFMGPGDMVDNTPFEFVVEHSDVRLDLLYVLPDRELPARIPDHDVAIVAVCQSDRNEALLARLHEALADWPRPVLNRPQAIARCAREVAERLLDGVPGLEMPGTRRLAREQIAWSGAPFTIRPIDTHAGEGLTRIDDERGLQRFLATHPDPDFYLARYVDYRSADGLYRKYRIALIDGLAYVCHVAISAHWIVHYRSAGMELSPSKRDEEAAAMAGFDAGFGARHRVALEAIAHRLGLDYVVLDGAETRDGRLLLFEADSRGWIHATDPVDLFPYKPAVMQKAFDAFRAMLEHHAQLR